MTVTATYHVPGAVLTEREHRVPLDPARPDGPMIGVFTREVADPDGTERPYLVFLQGGPGFEATRPTVPPSGWMKRALREYRVLLLDQRGTGRSTPVGEHIPGETAEDQAAYLAHFRADGIVADCEWIRKDLGVECGAVEMGKSGHRWTDPGEDSEYRMGPWGLPVAPRPFRPPQRRVTSR